MTLLVGTDEAGYGPNLGPLVVAATIWQVPDDDRDADLYHRLRNCVSTDLRRETTHLTIADSKRLYRPRGSLALLERGVLSCLSLLGQEPQDWRALLEVIGDAPGDRFAELPWYAAYNPRLPRSIGLDEVAFCRDRWRAAAATTGTRLVAMRACLVWEPEFNTQVQRYDSKGTVLSHTTLDLVAQLVAEFPAGPVQIVCDKHGGRNQYASLLQPRFGDKLVRVECESREQSSYQVGNAQRPIGVRFQVGGETFLPSALASMLAKFLRELSMEALNAYWQARLPGLRPTAGYPVDARRFWQEIEPLVRARRLEKDLLWRCR